MFLGITPESGILPTLSYLKANGMVGSTYSSNSLLHGLYKHAASLDYGQVKFSIFFLSDSDVSCNINFYYSIAKDCLGFDDKLP